MPRDTKTYDILISCPGDIKDEIEVISEVFETFNNSIGKMNSLTLNPIDWKRNSYPESGKKPQQLLNDQIVKKSDAVIALMWKRFGSKTDKYNSGTEEEIQIMLDDNKQVFMFFSNIHFSPMDVDTDQLSKVKEFKGNYGKNGIYQEYSNVEEFRQKLFNGLSSHFMRNLSIIESVNDELKSALEIKALVNGELSNNLTIKSDDKLLDSITEKIRVEINDLINRLNVKSERYNEIRKNIMTYREIDGKSIVSPRVQETLSQIAKATKDFASLGNSLFTEKECEVDGLTKKLITDYCEKYQISINSDFYNVEGLVSKTSVLNAQSVLSGYSQESTLHGNETLKEKYLLIEELGLKIQEFEDYFSFFNEYFKLNLIDLVVSNVGKKYDENIILKISMPKNTVVKPDMLPIPGIHADSIWNSTGNLCNYLYGSEVNSNVKSYINPQGNMINPEVFNNLKNTPLPLLFRTVQDDYDDAIYDYKREIERNFPYEYFFENERDIIKFEIKELGPNVAMSFPSKLIYAGDIEEIEYEIISKYQSDVIKGKIIINSN